MIARSIAASLSNTRRSVLLLGPRQTGKSTLMRSLAPDVAINLAREVEYLAFARHPGELEQRLAALGRGTVLIDEVQRLPSLLNTVQAIIDESAGAVRFLLTGSSARKLRRGHANLLPGRIVTYAMTPLLATELPHGIPTRALLSTGSLPGIWTDPDPDEARAVLASYASTYVREEVQAEALTRNLEGFSRFLFVAAAGATRQLDLSKLASAAAIARTSAQRYFEVLEDTLIFYRIDAWARTTSRRLLRHPRYFVFDNGVLNALLGDFAPGADRIGMLFENMVIGQIHHLVQAGRRPWRLASYRTAQGAAVDLIIEIPAAHRAIAIELKASANVGPSDLRGIASFAAVAGCPVDAYVFTLGGTARNIGDVTVLPWEDGVRMLAQRT